MQTDTAPMKREALAAIEARRTEIERLGDDIFGHAELGWFEERSAGVVAEALRGLGLPVEERLALTGVRAIGRGLEGGPTLAIVGELDGLPISDHPQANPATGAVHACGHNAQLAAMFGAAIGLAASGVLSRLAGRIVFFAVPAEEYVQLERRRELVREGRIELIGGKPELVRLGAFDDVDLGMMVHATSNPEHGAFSIYPSSNGLIGKQARFIGRAAHAGSAPHRGINALNAASLAVEAIAFQRETFRDADQIRIHPILTRGGDVVNIVPADVRLETYVRGASIEAIRDADLKVDRALRAGAMAIGANLEITTLPGFLPLRQDPTLQALFRANATELVGEDGWVEIEPIAASTDAGDLSHLMPFVHPSAGGFGGLIHSASFTVVDRELAYVNPARALAMTAIDLLANGAARARRLLDGYRPALSKAEYLALVRGFAREERFEV